MRISDNSSSQPADDNCTALVDDSTTVKFAKIMGYSILLVTSIFGNSVIIATVMRNKRMRTTVNYLIANVAASDFLISTFAVPIKLSEIVTKPRGWLLEGVLGAISCKLAYFLQDVSTAVSIISLVVISIDRYRGILYPFRSALITPKRCKIVIPLAWLSSMALHGIYFYFIRLESKYNINVCTVLPITAIEGFMIVLLVLFVLPFPVLAIVYSRIIINLRKERMVNGHSCVCLHKRHKENVKVITNVCAIFFVLAVCVLPIYIYGILTVTVWENEVPCKMRQFGFAAHFILFSNASVTPLIYFIFNVRYRQGLKHIFKGLHFGKKNVNERVEMNHLPPLGQ